MTHRADASSHLDNRGYTGPLIRGVNPATLLETAVRDRITESLYWKESCFGLNCATLLDRAVELTHIGGTYGVGMKPTPFLCLLFKLLTLNPSKEIVVEYLKSGGDEWKYVRCLAAFYVRLTFASVEVYSVLEGHLGDRRKIRRRRKEGWGLTYVDEFMDELLSKERTCATSLWKLPRREVLEDEGRLEARVSEMQAELDRELERHDVELVDGDGDGDGSEDGGSARGGSRSRSQSEDDSG